MNTRKYGKEGRALIAALLKEMTANGLEPDARDEAVLDVAAGIRDRMAELDALIKADGAMVKGPTGVVKLHPAVAEHRAQAIALARVLGTVQTSEVVTAPKDPGKQRAANARWRSHNLAKADGNTTPIRSVKARA